MDVNYALSSNGDDVAKSVAVMLLLVDSTSRVRVKEIMVVVSRLDLLGEPNHL